MSILKASSRVSEAGQPQRLRILPHHAIPVGPEALQLHAGAVSALIKGPYIQAIFARVVQLLDGTRTEAQVIEAAGARESIRRAAKFLVDALANNRLLEQVPDAPDSGPPGDGGVLGDYFAIQTLNRTRPLALIRSAKIEVLGSGPLTAALCRALGRLGVAQATCTEWTSELNQVVAGKSHVLALTEQPAIVDERVLALNDACIAAQTPFTPVSVASADVVQVGPMVLPGITACLACVRDHFQRANPFPIGIDELARPPRAPAEILPHFAQTVASLVTVELLRSFSSTRIPASSGAVVTMDVAAMKTSWTTYVKIPRCPRCGSTRNTPPLRLWA